MPPVLVVWEHGGNLGRAAFGALRNFAPRQAVDRVVAKLVNGIESNSMNTTPERVTCSPL